MKTYKKVELEAVNAPSGSYAAGCPTYYHGPGDVDGYGRPHDCRKCEVAQ